MVFSLIPRPFPIINYDRFIEDLGRQLETATDEANSKQYLLKRILVAILRGNIASVLENLGQQEGLFDPTLFICSLIFFEGFVSAL